MNAQPATTWAYQAWSRLAADSDTELVLDKPFEIRLPTSGITP